MHKTQKMYTWRTFLNLLHTLSNSVVEVVVGVFEIKKLNSDTKIFVHYTFSLKNNLLNYLTNVLHVLDNVVVISWFLMFSACKFTAAIFLYL